MSRRPVLAAVTALLLLAPASSARANPAITVDSAMLPGSTSSLPLTARHVLTLTAGAAPERLTVSVNPTVKLTVVNATVERPTAATGPSLTTCPGRWNRIRRHHVFRTANPHEAEATFTIAAGQTATVTADATIVRTPFDDDTPDAEWSIEPAQGGPFTIVSAAPRGLRGAAGGLRALLGRRARVRQQRLDLRDVAARPLETVADAWTIDGRRSVWPRARTRGCRTPLHSR